MKDYHEKNVDNSLLHLPKNATHFMLSREVVYPWGNYPYSIYAVVFYGPPKEEEPKKDMIN